MCNTHTSTGTIRWCDSPYRVVTSYRHFWGPRNNLSESHSWIRGIVVDANNSKWVDALHEQQGVIVHEGHPVFLVKCLLIGHTNRQVLFGDLEIACIYIHVFVMWTLMVAKHGVLLYITLSYRWSC
jgi:hypothetical protein